MSFDVEFRVLAKPQPKGSWVRIKRPPWVIPANAQSKAWERAVSTVALRVRPPRPLDCPVRLEIEFWLERPGNPKFAAAPAARIDLDKLVRSTGDALTGLLYVDDSRIVELVATKKFGPSPGARIRVISLDDDSQKELF